MVADLINYSRSLIDRVKAVTDRWRVDKEEEENDTQIKTEKEAVSTNITTGKLVITESAATAPATATSLIEASPFFQAYNNLMGLTVTDEVI